MGQGFCAIGRRQGQAVHILTTGCSSAKQDAKGKMSWRWLSGLTFIDLVRQTWRETLEDKIFGRAAELAYYFLLALFPMLIFLTSLIGFLPEAQEHIFRSLAFVMPGEAMQLVDETMRDVVRNRSGGLLSFGVLGAVWAASGGIGAVMDTLNVAYDANEKRSFFKARATAIGLTILLSVLVVGGVILMIGADHLGTWLANRFGIPAGSAVIGGVVEYTFGLALAFLGLQLMYYFGPDVKQSWKWITPGAVFAVASLIITSMLLSLYLRYGPSYSATYGGLGAVIVLLLWLYLMGAVILIGGEINAELRAAAEKSSTRASDLSVSNIEEVA